MSFTEKPCLVVMVWAMWFASFPSSYQAEAVIAAFACAVAFVAARGRE